MQRFFHISLLIFAVNQSDRGSPHESCTSYLLNVSESSKSTAPLLPVSSAVDRVEEENAMTESLPTEEDNMTPEERVEWLRERVRLWLASVVVLFIDDSSLTRVSVGRLS